MARAEPVIVDLGGGQYEVRLSYKPKASAGSVHVAGTFNDWNPRTQPMEGPDENGVYAAVMILNKGYHEYKFVVDGRTWRTDPGNPAKTPGYRNAILYLGIEPKEARPPTEALPAVELAGEVPHPAVIQLLVTRLAEKDPVKRTVGAINWFATNPMPVFTASAVTFVYRDPLASQVSLRVTENGRRTGYAMRRLVEGAAVWAVSLDCTKMPDRMSYEYIVTTPAGDRPVVDPCAWSYTSRSGQPAAWAVQASDRRGRIEVMHSVRPTRPGLLPRDIYVYLPPGYDSRPDERYPVLFMHDGQNCWEDPVEPFGHGGWYVNLTADEMINGGVIRPFIAVGIANTVDRLPEYGPGEDILSVSKQPYLQFLKSDIKPLVDAKYRTKPDAANTAVMGSSMGGVISFQAALSDPATFGQAACLSPAFGFDGPAAEAAYVSLLEATGKVPVRLYLDNGTAGERQDGAPITRAMVARLRTKGWRDGHDLLHFEDEGAPHNERAWRARLEKPLRFLFGK